MQVLPVIDDTLIDQIETIILDFLLQGKKEKIALPILKRNKFEGGLGLVDIRTKHVALLTNWIIDCKENHNIENLAVNSFGIMVLEGQIWKLNLTKKDSEILFPGNTFWHSLLHLWHSYSYHEPQNSETVLSQSIYYNSMIVV